MESNYKRIEFGQDGIPVEVPMEQPAEVIQTVDTPVDDVQAVEQAQPAAPRKYKSRAKERIEQLAREKNDFEALATQQAQELAELRKRVAEGSKQSKEDLKTSLERQVITLTQQLKEYMKAGEPEKSVEAQESLMEAKIKLASLAADIANQSRAQAVDSAQSQPIRSQPTIPEAAQNWINQFPEFNEDMEFRGAALKVNNQLVREGWDPGSEDFYEEISNRLGKKFPEVFGIEEENGVQLSQNKIPSPEANNGQQDANNQVAQPSARPAQPSPKRTTAQTVSSSSRPASPSVQQPKKGLSVDFTPEEISQADAWGIPLEKLARRIVHQEQTRRPDGYTEIFIPKK